jgi:peptidase, M24 family
MNRSDLIQQRLAALRDAMKRHKLDVYFVPTADPHNSEYIAEHWKTREWFSGFRGSAGTLVVSADKAALWTDSRYFLQAEEELSSTGIELMKDGLAETTDIVEWIRTHCSISSANFTVGLDYATCGTGQYCADFSNFATKDVDLAAEIWKDRPALPKRPIVCHPAEWTSKTAGEKIELVRRLQHELIAKKLKAAAPMAADSARNLDESAETYFFYNDISEIAWLLNLRGEDIEFNPVFLSYLLVGERETHLFAHLEALDEIVRKELESHNITLHPYESAANLLRSLDPKKTIIGYAESMNQEAVEIFHQLGFHSVCTSPVTPIPALRAIKDEREIAGFRRAMQLDGVAMVRFRRALDEIIEKGEIAKETELSIEQRLTAFRAEHPDFRGLSFGTIAGYGAHGAIVHYEADEESNATLAPRSFLLLDSGAHYVSGTTDITRTIPLGPLTDEERKAYTLVLKGHIALARARFPERTQGLVLDFAARYAMWQEGMDFGHGTGHGVGCHLCVHEGPQQIRKNTNAASTTPFVAGMTITDEPGIYISGKFGVRLENVLLTREAMKTDFGRFLEFETLTLCPFDTTPIIVEMLDENERNWLNRYHETVRKQLLPLLADEKDRAWLERATLPL